MNRLKKIFFVYPKYIFLIFLAYLLYALNELPDYEINTNGFILGLILPFIPVWLSFHFSRKIEKDIEGSWINIFTFFAPLAVIITELYFMFSVKAPMMAILAAFGVGTMTFAVTLGLNLSLSLFAKTA
ncbi:hypothetical protein SOPP22_12515 [Shewanella sp. OPT22]|nr:hypothetical protein SOPP22_12515 [Shewanella sp. OPT22]